MYKYFYTKGYRLNYNFYLPLIVILILTVMIPFLFHLSRYLGDVTKDNTAINQTYESGIKKIYKDSFERFNVKFIL